MELTFLTDIEIPLTVGHIHTTVPAETVVDGVVLRPRLVTVATVSLGLRVASLGVVDSVVNITNNTVQTGFFFLILLFT